MQMQWENVMRNKKLCKLIYILQLKTNPLYIGRQLMKDKFKIHSLAKCETSILTVCMLGTTYMEGN